MKRMTRLTASPVGDGGAAAQARDARQRWRSPRPSRLRRLSAAPRSSRSRPPGTARERSVESEQHHTGRRDCALRSAAATRPDSSGRSSGRCSTGGGPRRPLGQGPPDGSPGWARDRRGSGAGGPRRVHRHVTSLGEVPAGARIGTSSLRRRRRSSPSGRIWKWSTCGATSIRAWPGSSEATSTASCSPRLAFAASVAPRRSPSRSSPTRSSPHRDRGRSRSRLATPTTGR